MSEYLSENRLLSGLRPYLLIILACLLLYIKTVSFGFTHLDDKQIILDNYSFISKLSNIPQAFREKVFLNSLIPYYRPILTTTFILDSQLGGSMPMVYHLTNIFIHAVASCLIFSLFIKLRHRTVPALFFSLLFAVHPLLTQGVAWIPGRNDSLLAVFAMSAFIFFLNYLDGKSFPAYLAHMIFFAIALFTKESGLAIALLSLAYVYIADRTGLAVNEKVLLISGWVVITAFWLSLRQAALAASFETTLVGMAMSLFVSLPALVQFIGKVIFPFNLSVFPTIKTTTFFWGVLAIASVTASLAFSRNKRKGLVLFGILWFLLFLLATFIRPTHQCVLDFQEHRVYTPIIGFFIMLLEIDLFKNLNLTKKAASLSCLLVIALFSIMTFRHSDAFRDRFAFWDNACRTSRNAAFVRLSRGFIYHLDGALDKAEKEYKISIALDTDLPRAHLKLGLVYLDRKMFKEAREEFRKEILADPFSDNAYLSLGVVCYKEGRPKDAESMWLETLKINPGNVDAMKNLAIYYYDAGDYKRSDYFAGQLKKRGVVPPEQFLKGLQDKL